MTDLLNKAIAVKERNERAIDQLMKSVGLDGDRNDKHQLCIELKVGNGRYGYYGSSSCYRIDFSEQAVEALEGAAQRLKRTLVRKAVNILEEEVEAAMVEAKTQATVVLNHFAPKEES